MPESSDDRFAGLSKEEIIKAKNRERALRYYHKHSDRINEVRRIKARNGEYTEYQRKWRKEHPKSGIEAKRRYRQNHPDRIKAYREANKDRDKQWREEHKEEIKAYLKEYRKTHPVNRATVNTYLVGYRKENYNKIYNQQKAWVGSHRELSKGYSQKYRDEHPEYLEIQAERQRQFRKNNPDEARKMDIRHNSKRCELGFIPLNEYFDGSEAHHTDKVYIIYIPYDLHHLIYHRQDKPETMIRINELAWEWFWTHDVPPSIDDGIAFLSDGRR